MTGPPGNLTFLNFSSSSSIWGGVGPGPCFCCWAFSLSQSQFIIFSYALNGVFFNGIAPFHFSNNVKGQGSDETLQCSIGGKTK
jgi:hypothetical protein